MLILKTIFTSEFELLYVLAQILEFENIVDRFVITEPTFTHTGEKRRIIGIDSILPHMGPLTRKVDYIPLVDSENITQATLSEKLAHRNETVTRGDFVRYLPISPSDIVISTDADEVLYAEKVERIISSRRFHLNPVAAHTLTLHQFMYQDNLLAKGHSFTGPSVTKARRELFLPTPRDWRYIGPTIQEPLGCHFSWCLPVRELVKKVRSFAHGPSYFRSDQHAQQQIESDIENLAYTFRSPQIKLTRIDRNEFLLPSGYKRALQLMGAKSDNL